MDERHRDQQDRQAEVDAERTADGMDDDDVDQLEGDRQDERQQQVGNADAAQRGGGGAQAGDERGRQ